MSAERTNTAKVSKVTPVNCTDDVMMEKEGLRLPLFKQDPEWSRKTLAEKKAMSRIYKIRGLRASAPGRTIRLAKHRITVHLKNLQQVPDFITTYSEMLYKDEIRDYMNTFFDKIRNEVKVVYFNGKVVPYNV